MTNKTVHALIAQQVQNIMDDKKITSYKLLGTGVSQGNLEAILQKRDVSYTLKTLKKVCDEIGVKSISIDFNEGSVMVLAQ